MTISPSYSLLLHFYSFFRNVPDYSIFIGDLPPGATDEMLFDLFAAKYQSVRTAKIVTDKDTGAPKGSFSPSLSLSLSFLCILSLPLF
jgi:hypothetical protein